MSVFRDPINPTDSNRTIVLLLTEGVRVQVTCKRETNGLALVCSVDVSFEVEDEHVLLRGLPILGAGSNARNLLWTSGRLTSYDEVPNTVAWFQVGTEMLRCQWTVTTT